MAALIPGLQARQSSTSLLNQLFSRRLCKGANYFSRSEILSGADSNMILSALCERSRRGHFDSNHSHLILLPVSHCPLGQPHLFPPPWVWDRHSLADSRVYVKKKNNIFSCSLDWECCTLGVGGCSELGWQVWDGLGWNHKPPWQLSVPNRSHWCSEQPLLPHSFLCTPNPACTSAGSSQEDQERGGLLGVVLPCPCMEICCYQSLSTT